MPAENYLAFDFGAQSARAIHGKLDSGKLEIAEMYRFVTGGSKDQTGLKWDVSRFFKELKLALKTYVNSSQEELVGIGIDSWGVDFVLLDKNREPISNPYHYRDKRTNNIYKYAFQLIPREEIYKKTGIQFMQINTLFQLASMVRDNSPVLKKADKFLMIADYFHYLLTKRVACEYTLATTSQLYDLEEQNWSSFLIKRLGLNTSLFPEIVQSGTVLGTLVPSIAKEVGLKDVLGITPAAHDTAAAIAAVPAVEKDFIYISSGTWSLMGVELDKPLISEEALRNNFTNEGGIFKTIRFLKNISGLWILSEAKKVWDAVVGNPCSYEQLNQEARASEPFKCFIDPDHSSFLSPENMVEAISQYCKMTKQEIPQTRGGFVRCILESLAMKYKFVYNMIRNMLKKSFNILHIVGGGAQNQLLSQFAANATKLKVKSGPIEATAIGNLLVQVSSQNPKMKFADLRRIIRNSFNIQTLMPHGSAEWDENYKDFLQILKF
ncbi:MAG: rhamnulokinase [Candidatus Helarchaeota archaeon]